MSEQIFTQCTEGGPILVHVKDGKITRVRPIVFDEKDAPSWTIEANGRKVSPPRKTCPAPFTLTQRVTTYSEDRLLYPMKRRDFDPNGKRNTQNRGKSGYERISWDKALDIVAGEIKRIKDTYGPAAILAKASSHHNWGSVGFHTSVMERFFKFLGFTDCFDNPDSWEGWVWGSIHTWGYYWRLGMPEQYDLLEDALKNAELIIYWSSDPDTTHGCYAGSEANIWRVWLRELGKKQIFIDPFCNYTAAVMADKWIAPRPGTDAAMAMAIAYVWIKEDTYDKEYVATHTIGFEQFRKQIMGEDDGVPKTPGWAEKICGVPGRVITALAREWASKRTMLSCGCRGGEGSANRHPYGHEWARLMVLLQAMQGLGKLGVNIWGGASGAPFNASFKFPGFGPGIALTAKKVPVNPVTQRLYRLLIPDAILNPPVHWLGEGFCFNSIEQQFIPYTYPKPGSPEIKMFYRYGGSFIGTMPEGNKWIQAYQSPKLELVVNQDCWWCTETKFADIILPACTQLERNDIGEASNCSLMPDSGNCNHRVIVYQHKCIEPVGESRSDYQIFSDLAERLGFKEEYTEGNTEEEWIRQQFESSDMPKYMSLEEFKKKGYFVVPMPEGRKPTPTLRWFNEGRECDTPDRDNIFKIDKDKARPKELGTYSGKIEFVSQSLLKHFPDDEERPPMPRYIPSWEGHTSELAKKYPLQLISPHARFSIHTRYDHTSPNYWLGDIPGHRIFKDGNYWHTTRIHPVDADARGIKDGDIVKIYNDRGAVLGIAQITERVRPGVIHSYQASGKYDPIQPGKPYSVDRAGCVNILTSLRFMSKNAPGMAPMSCLVEISKWEV